MPGAEQPHRTPGIVEPLDDKAVAFEHDRGTRVHAAGAAVVSPLLRPALVRVVSAVCVVSTGHVISTGRGISSGRGIDSRRVGHGAAGPVRVERIGPGVADHEAFDSVRADPPLGHERTGRLAPGKSPDLVEPLAVEHLGEQAHAAAAALAEIGPQREPVEGGERGISRERVARHADRLPLQLAAADGPAEAAVRRNDHARTGLARRGAAHRRNRHQRTPPVRADHLRHHRPDPHPLNPPSASAPHPPRATGIRRCKATLHSTGSITVARTPPKPGCRQRRTTRAPSHAERLSRSVIGINQHYPLDSEQNAYFLSAMREKMYTFGAAG